MNLTKKFGTLFLALGLIFSTTEAAQAKFAAVGPKISSIGGGIEGRVHLANNFFLRGGVVGFEYSTTFDDANITYDGDVQLLNVPIMIDFHPFAGSGFRISAGLAYNDNEVKVTATENNIFRFLNGFDPIVTTKTATATIRQKNSIAPIVTVGYDGSLVDSGFITFDFEVGVMYTGNADISVTTIDVARDAEELRLLTESIKKATNDIRKRIELYPVIALGLKINF